MTTQAPPSRFDEDYVLENPGAGVAPHSGRRFCGGRVTLIAAGELNGLLSPRLGARIRPRAHGANGREAPEAIESRGRARAAACSPRLYGLYVSTCGSHFSDRPAARMTGRRARDVLGGERTKAARSRRCGSTTSHRISARRASISRARRDDLSASTLMTLDCGARMQARSLRCSRLGLRGARLKTGARFGPTASARSRLLNPRPENERQAFECSRPGEPGINPVAGRGVPRAGAPDRRGPENKRRFSVVKKRLSFTTRERRLLLQAATAGRAHRPSQEARDKGSRTGREP